MTNISIRDTQRTDTWRAGEGHVKTEVEFGVMWKQAEELLEPPEAGAGGGKDRSSPRAFWGSTVHLTP